MKTNCNLVRVQNQDFSTLLKFTVLCLQNSQLSIFSLCGVLVLLGMLHLLSERQSGLSFV